MKTDYQSPDLKAMATFIFQSINNKLPFAKHTRDPFPTEELVNAKANFPDLTAGMRVDEYIYDKYIFQWKENISVYVILYRIYFQSVIDTREVTPFQCPRGKRFS